MAISIPRPARLPHPNAVVVVPPLNFPPPATKASPPEIAAMVPRAKSPIKPTQPIFSVRIVVNNPTCALVAPRQQFSQTSKALIQPAPAWASRRSVLAAASAVVPRTVPAVADNAPVKVPFRNALQSPLESLITLFLLQPLPPSLHRVSTPSLLVPGEKTLREKGVVQYMDSDCSWPDRPIRGRRWMQPLVGDAVDARRPLTGCAVNSLNRP